MSIAQVKICRIDKYSTSVFGGHIETPEDRFGKRFLRDSSLIRVFAECPERVIGLDEQYLRADTLEFHDPALPQLTPVEADIVGSDPGREGIYIEKLSIPFRDLKPH